MAEHLDDLRVFQMAMEFWRSVTPLFDRAAYRKDRDLRDQTSRANDSIPSNISEGFEQGSDAAFVQYLYHSKGSVGEVVSRLRQAQLKGYISEPELAGRVAAADRLSRSLGALIRYLDSCGWRDRGRHKSRRRAEELKSRPSGPEDAPSNTSPTKNSRLTTEGPRTGESGPTTRNSGPGTDDPGITTLDPRPGTHDPGLTTRDSRPGTQDPGLGTRD